ncbi:ankyrin repeat domain-containing protein, partial [Zooshikella harenae]
AASNGYYEIAEMLCKKGINIEYRDRIYKEDALTHAIFNQQVEVLKVLIKYGANVNTKNKYNSPAGLKCLLGMSTNYENPDKVEKRNKCFDILLKSGLDLNIPVKQNEDSYLVSAAYCGDEKLVEMLINVTDEVGINFYNKETKFTALDMALNMRTDYPDVPNPFEVFSQTKKRIIQKLRNAGAKTYDELKAEGKI